MAFCLIPEAPAGHVAVRSEKGRATFDRFDVREVSSVWEDGAGEETPGRNARDR